MGNTLSRELYREKPLKDFKCLYGWAPYFRYGAATVTGWRKTQEDRIVCRPDFTDGFGLFAVYDGHGGAEVSQYLQDNYDNHLLHALKSSCDIETAILISFLSCDYTLKNITEQEYVLIKEAVDTTFRVDEISTSTNPEFRSIVKTEIAKFFQERAFTGQLPKTLSLCAKPLIASSSTMQQLFVQPLKEEDDEEDEDYVVEQEEDDQDDYEIDEEDLKTVLDNTSNPALKEAKSVLEEGSKASDKITVDDKKPLVGYAVGSTATVLFLNEDKAYVANVGDSRCVACVKGKAVELTKDHLPTNSEEYLRIIESGHEVKDDRIDGMLNVSRAFGDFGLKATDSQSPFDAVICEPFISVLELSNDVEFIIIASDGIWNESSSQSIVDFVKYRQDEDPHDICTELFELFIPSELTDDGSGCDNMSAVIIFFEEHEDLKGCIERAEEIRFSYNHPNMIADQFSDEEAGDASDYEERAKRVKYDDDADTKNEEMNDEKPSDARDYEPAENYEEQYAFNPASGDASDYEERVKRVKYDDDADTKNEEMNDEKPSDARDYEPEENYEEQYDFNPSKTNDSKEINNEIIVIDLVSDDESPLSPAMSNELSADMNVDELPVSSTTEEDKGLPPGEDMN